MTRTITRSYNTHKGFTVSTRNRWMTVGVSNGLAREQTGDDVLADPAVTVDALRTGPLRVTR